MHTSRPIIGITIYLIISCPLLFAKDLLVNPLSRDDLVQRVLNQHPDKEKWALGIRHQELLNQDAGLWERPSLRLTNQGESMLGGDGKGALVVAIEQKIPLGQRNSLSKSKAQTQSQITKEEVRLHKLRVAKTTEEIWIELAFLRSKRKQLNRISELNQQLKDFLSKSSGMGEASSLDVSEAELELAALQSELLHLDERNEVLSQKIREELGLDSLESLGIDTSDFFKTELVGNLKTDLLKHPEVILSSLGLNRRQLEFKLTKTSRLDHLDFEVEWEEEKDVGPLGSQREGSLGLSISMPLPLRGEKPGSIKAAGVAVEEAREHHKVLLYRLQKKGERLLSRHKNLTRHLKVMDSNVLSKNDYNLELHRKAYKEGQTDQSRLIRAQEHALKHRLDRLQILKELAEVGAEWRELTSFHLSSVQEGEEE